MPITFEEVTASIEPERGSPAPGGGSPASASAAPGGAPADELAAQVEQQLRLAAERRARLADD